MSEKKDTTFEIYSDSEKMLEQIVDKYDLPDQSKALRGNGAVIGQEWDAANQIFWKAQPWPSWVKDVPNAQWVSPIGDAPDDLTAEEVAAGTYYSWDEDVTNWVKLTIPSVLD